MNKEKKEVIAKAKKEWKYYGVDDNGEFIKEPSSFDAYHRKLLKELGM